jgi:tetrahedral aminopeptidase
MEKSSFEFLKKFICTYTPSGFESEGQLLWKKRTETFSEKIHSDVHGNMIACINQKAKTRIMLAGHCDEIGFMVTHITDEGFIHFAAIGGVDVSVLPGMQVKFLTKNNICGIIGKKPIHMVDKEDRKKALDIKDLMIDIGSKSKKETEKYIRVGTSACILSNFMPLLNDFIASKAWDDKVGAFVVSEVMRMLNERKKQLKVAVYGVSTVQEEIGSRGARTSCFGIDPHAGIAIDVGFATDVPGDDKKVFGNVKLGNGPILHRGANINIPLGNMFEKTAENKKIDVQWSAEPSVSGTDADVIQINRCGVAAALVSIPTRYMHTPVELCAVSDIDNTVDLIVETILSMPENPNFLPY